MKWQIYAIENVEVISKLETFTGRGNFFLFTLSLRNNIFAYYYNASPLLIAITKAPGHFISSLWAPWPNETNELDLLYLFPKKPLSPT